MHNWPEKIRSFIYGLPLLPTVFSMGWNFGCGIVNLLIAFIFTSYWYAAMSVYYLLLGLMRISAVTVRSSRWRLCCWRSGLVCLGWRGRLPSSA